MPVNINYLEFQLIEKIEYIMFDFDGIKEGWCEPRSYFLGEKCHLCPPFSYLLISRPLTMLNTYLWEYKQEQEILNLYMLETNGKYEMMCFR